MEALEIESQIDGNMPEVPFRREVEPSYPPITRSPSMTSSSLSACDTKSVPYFDMVVEIRSRLFPVERAATLMLVKRPDSS